MNKSIPTHLGYSSVRDNVGSVRNQGFEIMLNTENIRLKDFSWQTTFTLSYNKNEIVDLAFKEDLGVYSDRLKGMQGDYNNRWFIGQPVQLNWDLETIGVWQLGEEEAAKKYGQKPGQFKVSDYNNDGVINDKDRFINGSRIPNWTGGMTNTFRYQEFDLSFHMHFQTGARLRNQFYVSYALENNNANLGNMKKDYWTPENPTNSCAQPSNMGPYRDQNTTGKSVSHIVQKTDFLKVSYITLGYTFKKNLLNRIKMSNLRLYATVQNPFTFTGFSGFDPEQPSEQVSNSDMITCNVLLGLNVSF